MNAETSIRDAIDSSPYLQQRLEKEMADGQLDRIVIQDRKGEYGSFNDKTRAISVDADVFKEFGKDKKELGDALTYVIGHEVGHSNLRVQRVGAIDALADAGKNSQWVESENGSVNMTPAVHRYLDASRQDEARSEIEGWNALASRVVQDKGKDFTQEVLLVRARPISSFVERGPDGLPQLTQGVSLTNDAIVHPGRSVPSPNVEAVGDAYFTPELRARYGTYAIETLARNSDSFVEDAKQKPTEIELDLKSLGLSKTALEEQGLDLGGPGRSFSITDTSNGGRSWISFKHTKDKGDSLNPPSDEPTQTAASSSDQPGQRYMEQALIAIRSSPHIPAGTFTKEEEERLAGSLSEAALSATPPLTRIDHVVLGKKPAGHRQT